MGRCGFRAKFTMSTSFLCRSALPLWKRLQLFGPLPGSPSLGWQSRRRACPEALGPPRSRVQPKASRAASTGTERMLWAQVDTCSCVCF